MSVTRDDLSQPESALEEPLSARPVAVRRGRVLAVAVALMVVAVLAVGWLVDNVGSAPQAPTRGALTQQVGLDTVILTISTAPQRASDGAPQTEALLVHVRDASGAAVVGARAQCALSMPSMAMALPPITGASTGQPGVYRCPAQGLSSGPWTLALTLTLPSGETDHSTFSFVVA